MFGIVTVTASQICEASCNFFKAASRIKRKLRNLFGSKHIGFSICSLKQSAVPDLVTAYRIGILNKRILSFSKRDRCFRRCHLKV